MTFRQMIAICLTALASWACGTPLTPTIPPPDPLPPPPAKIWLLAGQSNAVGVGPYLRPFADTLIEVSQGAQPIAAWNSNQPLGQALDQTLVSHPELTAIIWEQGEADAVSGSLTYATDLQRLIDRMRRYTACPIVIVGPPDMPADRFPVYSAQYAALEATQQEIAQKNDLWTVSSHDLPTYIDPASGVPWHLSPEGYANLAIRITAELTRPR